MTRHETASSKPSPDTVANIENPTQAEDLDQYGGGWAGATGGSAAQVFEVTNLTIPSGTDWSSGVGHQLGTLAGGLRYADLNLFEFFIELAADGPDDVVLDALDDPDYAAYTIGASFTITSGGVGIASGDGVAGLSVITAAVPPAGHVAVAWRGAHQGFAGQPLHIGIHTNSVTTADITVVRARAAFLVV